MAAKKKAKKARKAVGPVKPKAKNDKAKLTPRQEAFVENYVANGNKNATDAARKAGISGTSNSLPVKAHRLLRNVKVQDQIQERVRQRLKGVKASADELYYLLADHLRADFGDLENCFANGKFDLKLAKQQDLSRLVRKLKIRELESGETVTEIELHDSQAAAYRLAQMMGLLQQPKQNEDDTARWKAELAKLVSEGWTPELARDIVVEAEPASARYLN